MGVFPNASNIGRTYWQPTFTRILFWNETWPTVKYMKVNFDILTAWFLKKTLPGNLLLDHVGLFHKLCFFGFVLDEFQFKKPLPVLMCFASGSGWDKAESQLKQGLWDEQALPRCRWQVKLEGLQGVSRVECEYHYNIRLKKTNTQYKYL